MSGTSFILSYVYDCEIEYHGSNGMKHNISQYGLKYLFINHDYENAVMPVAYMHINLPLYIYNKMAQDQSKGKIFLRITTQKLQSSKVSDLKNNAVFEELDYYISDDPNTYSKLPDEKTKASEERGISTNYKTCLIGLTKLELQKKNQKVFEGIISKNTTTMSLVREMTKDFKMVIQPFHNNTELSSLVCPPITSIGKFISYLNDKASFYRGGFMYYMDFTKTYLRSHDGSYINANDGHYSTVMFHVEDYFSNYGNDMTANKAFNSGLVVYTDKDKTKNAYIVYLSGSDIQIAIDRNSPLIVSNIDNISAIDGDIKKDTVNTEKITNIGKSSASAMIISQDKNAAANMSKRMSENSVTLTISKIDMNTTIFTPNRQYMLSYYLNNENTKFCGLYYLVRKDELYLRIGETLKCQLTLTLKKCTE